MIFGSIPAGGLGTRLQPLGFSKELAPVGGLAVIEYLIEAMIEAGVEKIFVNTAGDKQDLIAYLASREKFADQLLFTVRERAGLHDGILVAGEVLRPDDQLLFGLPDTIWAPRNAFTQIVNYYPEEKLVLGLFDSGKPQCYDSVEIDESGKIQRICVKIPQPATKWTWGIGRIQVSEIPKIYELAELQGPDPLFGVAMNEYSRQHPAFALELQGSSYIDVGTHADYERAGDFVRNNLK